MKHTNRQHGQLTQIDCEFGSGVFDQNGREFIEGDIVRCGWTDKVVILRRGCFMLIDKKDLPRWQTCGGLLFNMFLFPESAMIIGHVEEG